MIRAGVRIDIPCHCEAIHGIKSTEGNGAEYDKNFDCGG